MERISGNRVHFLRGLADILLKEKLKKKKKNPVLYFQATNVLLSWVEMVGGEAPEGRRGKTEAFTWGRRRLKAKESNADTQPGHGGFGPSFLTR